MTETIDDEFSERIILDEKTIQNRVKELVEEIARDFRGKDIVVVGILKGSYIFLADLSRLMYKFKLNPQVDFTILSSYGSSTEPITKVKIDRDISIDVEGKAVLVVDDILDTGRTMQYVKERMHWLEPEFTKTCVFLDKPARRQVKIEADYVGFTVEDNFYVGYGLDYNGFYRERPYVAVLESQADKKQ